MELLFLGIFIGIIAGFFGIGGGTLLVPLLLYFNFDFKEAIGISIIQMVFSSIFGTYLNNKAGTIKLKKGGSIRFFEKFSIQGLSGDAIIQLENGKNIRLFNLKTKKIRDLADEFVPDKENYGKGATLVGHGFTTTYEMLDNLSKKPTKKQKNGWMSKLGFSKN